MQTVQEETTTSFSSSEQGRSLSTVSTLNRTLSENDKELSTLPKIHASNTTASGRVGEIDPANRGNEDFIVQWDGSDDVEEPRNWPAKRKWTTTTFVGLCLFVSAFASAVMAPSMTRTSEKFHVNKEVTHLEVGTFVIGLALGPIIWGPFSELYGRKRPLLTGFAIFAMFHIPVGLATRVWTIIVCRFFSGVAGSASMAIGGGVVADLFHCPVQRRIAVACVNCGVIIGPLVACTIDGYITTSRLGWRWGAWITLTMAAWVEILGLFFIHETFTPTLLQRKARRLRLRTKNWAIHAPADEKDTSLKEIVTRHLSRPFAVLIVEPILLAITIYMSLIYGIIYLAVEAVSYSFVEQRKWRRDTGGLPYLSVVVGVLAGTSIVIWSSSKNKGERSNVHPEQRLKSMMMGGFLLPVGLLGFGWTSFLSLNPWPQIIAAVPIGMGSGLIFSQGLNYIVDIYKMNANSAIAANIFLRSIVAAAFVFAALPIFRNLGIPWTMSTLGFASIVLCPVPFVFYIYGPRIRHLSRYSFDY